MIELNLGLGSKRGVFGNCHADPYAVSIPWAIAVEPNQFAVVAVRAASVCVTNPVETAEIISSMRAIMT